mmetsp:Transcript_4310/g.4073  ORF Transcript_4310/g.4073 Transcript_4310/m.4073 type:complete len:227 (+) Transcript_4310:1246-1926(+)
MVSLIFAESQDDLLKEAETFVDEGGFFKNDPSRASLLGPFRASKVHKVQLRVCKLILGLHPGSTFHIDGEDTVGSGRMLVHLMLTDSFLKVSLEEHVQGIFFILADYLAESLDHDSSLGVFLDLDVHSRLVLSRHRGEQVKYHFIVDLCITHPDSDSMSKHLTSLLVDLIDGSRNDPSVLEVSTASSHGEGLPRPCLSIAHDRPIESFHRRGNKLTGTLFKNFILS